MSNEVDKVRAAYLHDHSISHAEYGRLIQEAAEADRAADDAAELPERERRFWLMPDCDPEGRPWGIVDETCGGIIAYGADEACAEFLLSALDYLEDHGLIEIQDYLSTSDGRVIR